VEHLSVALGLLTADDPGVRSAAAAACATLAASVGPRLLPLLEDADAMVRADAIDAIATINFREAASAVMRLLHDEDASVRASAAEALGWLDSREARISLEKALLDEDEAVRGFAASSLGRLQDSDALVQLDALLELEVSAAVKAEIYAAEYRLGRQHQLRPLLDTIMFGDEARTTSVAMNALLDLLSYPVCGDLYGSYEDIARALEAAVRKDAIHAGHARNILSRLEGPH
jgi:HEAT repeat protein